jgi:branched-chain amino acid transport system ATP-binding protein
MLKLENFSCGYGQVKAVEGLNIHIRKGEAFALLGPNGAGKTSTIMAIMGHVAVQSGRILVEGHDITGVSPVSRVKYGMALVPEGRRLFADLTVEENLIVGGYAFSRKEQQKQRDEVYSLFPRLGERRRQVANSLSGGEQQMLAIGRALMANPRLLLVDELSLGLMPKMVDLCFEALANLRARGITILLVEQNSNRAIELVQNVCVIASGATVYNGSAAGLLNNATIFEKYVGVGD